MSYRELFYTAICNLFPFLRKISNKRWYSMNKGPWVILDDPDNVFVNEELERDGFRVLDYRRRK
jgi:hypothetical protein